MAEGVSAWVGCTSSSVVACCVSAVTTGTCSSGASTRAATLIQVPSSNRYQLPAESLPSMKTVPPMATSPMTSASSLGAVRSSAWTETVTATGTASTTCCSSSSASNVGVGVGVAGARVGGAAVGVADTRVAVGGEVTAAAGVGVDVASRPVGINSPQSPGKKSATFSSSSRSSSGAVNSLTCGGKASRKPGTNVRARRKAIRLSHSILTRTATILFKITAISFSRQITGQMTGEAREKRTMLRPGRCVLASVRVRLCATKKTVRRQHRAIVRE